jgi:signal transduction histidine kinase
VQRATAAVLNAIYEEDFLGFSYGFRPGRGAHDALDAADLPLIRADADRLTQVIVNLISNAVKFCAPKDGRIQLETWQDAGFLRVDVKDHGIGIAKADQQKIFERSSRPGTPSRTNHRAQGLACRFPGRYCSTSAAKSGSIAN